MAKRTSNVPLGPQSPPSSPKSPGCRSRSGPGGPVVASPASSCSSSQRWTRARTKALVGTPLRRLWRRRRAWAPSSRRTDIDFRKGPISARTLHEPTSTRHRPPRRVLERRHPGCPQTRQHGCRVRLLMRLPLPLQRRLFLRLACKGAASYPGARAHHLTAREPPCARKRTPLLSQTTRPARAAERLASIRPCRAPAALPQS